MRSSLVVSFVAACLLIGAPAASATPGEAVGGPQLATDGVVVSPDPGAPSLPGGLDTTSMAYPTFRRFIHRSSE